MSGRVDSSALSVEVNGLVPRVNNAPAGGKVFVAHVHNKQCDVDASGGHWQVNIIFFFFFFFF